MKQLGRAGAALARHGRKASATVTRHGRRASAAAGATVTRHGQRASAVAATHGRRASAALPGVRPGRNPLVRRTDRIEAIALGALIVAAAAGAPCAAACASHWASASAAQASAATQAAVATQATLLATPASPGSPVTGYSSDGDAAVLARWTTQAGATRYGAVLVPAGSAKGARVTVWTDAAGDVTGPPLSASQAGQQGTYAAVIAAVITLAAALAAIAAARVLAARRRMARWDADWARTAPAWSTLDC